MDFASVVRQRLDELALTQRDLANAAEVTESYVSQLLARRKLPPAPNRTDLYEKMGRILGVPRLELARLAALDHHQALDETWQEAPAARFGPMRELILRKCRPASRRQIRSIVEKQPFGELEQLLTRTLIDVVRSEAHAHARDETWVRAVAERTGNTYREMRVRLIDLLDSDPRQSIGDFSAFLETLVASWDYDFEHFTLEVVLTSGVSRRFAFREVDHQEGGGEAGLRAFLRDARLSSGATPEEIEILRRMRFPAGGRPTALFYYRMLQSLRDPLHFKTAPRKR